MTIASLYLWPSSQIVCVIIFSNWKLAFLIIFSDYQLVCVIMFPDCQLVCGSSHLISVGIDDVSRSTPISVRSGNNVHSVWCFLHNLLILKRRAVPINTCHPSSLEFSPFICLQLQGVQNIPHDIDHYEACHNTHHTFLWLHTFIS